MAKKQVKKKRNIRKDKAWRIEPDRLRYAIGFLYARAAQGSVTYQDRWIRLRRAVKLKHFATTRALVDAVSYPKDLSVRFDYGLHLSDDALELVDSVRALISSTEDPPPPPPNKRIRKRS